MSGPALLALTRALDEKRVERIRALRENLTNELATLNAEPAPTALQANPFGAQAQLLAPRKAETKSAISSTHLLALQQRAEAERKQREEEHQSAVKAEREALAKLKAKQDAAAAVAAKQQAHANQLDAALRRHEDRVKRHDSAHTLDRNNKAVKSVKLHLRTLTNTRQDVVFRLDGTKNELGPRAVLDHVATTASKHLEPVMQVLADVIVQNASANLSVDAMKRGEANYGLAYLTLVLCHSRPAFIDFLLGALEAACPFIQPGLKDHIENEAVKHKWTKEQRKKRLGYKDEEERDDEYIVRMQALVGFYAVLLQTPPKLIESYVRLCAKPGSAPESVKTNPFGGLNEAWRWLARTLNSTKRRWTRFLIQAFLCIAGRELSLAVPTQMTKLLQLLASKRFSDACEPTAIHPSDDDRIRGFETFVKDSLDEVKSKGAMRGPGREEEDPDTGKKVWVDPRVLPEGARV